MIEDKLNGMLVYSLSLPLLLDTGCTGNHRSNARETPQSDATTVSVVFLNISRETVRVFDARIKTHAFALTLARTYRIKNNE